MFCQGWHKCPGPYCAIVASLEIINNPPQSCFLSVEKLEHEVLAGHSCPQAVSLSRGHQTHTPQGRGLKKRRAASATFDSDVSPWAVTWLMRMEAEWAFDVRLLLQLLLHQVPPKCLYFEALLSWSKRKEGSETCITIKNFWHVWSCSDYQVQRGMCKKKQTVWLSANL